MAFRFFPAFQFRQQQQENRKPIGLKNKENKQNVTRPRRARFNNSSRTSSNDNNNDNSSNSNNNKSSTNLLESTLPQFGPIERPVHSIFAPREFSIAQGQLANCWVIQDILNAPCDERLIQERYYDITSQRTIFFTNPPSQLTYSIINSIVADLIKRRGKNVCTAGRVLLYLQGKSSSRGKKNNIVIPEATITNFDFTQNCQNAKLIYVPLDVQWLSSPDLIQQARRDDGEFKCQGNCTDGHAMAIIINNERKTVDVFDSNGKNTPWYLPIFDYITEIINNNPQFTGFAMENTPGCLPTYGPQSISGLPMCVLFANLYAILRLLCIDIPPEIIIQELIDLGKAGIQNLLQRFYCYLIDYGQDRGIFQAADYLQDIYSQVQNKLLNFGIYGRKAKHNKQYYENLQRQAELLAFNDIISAIRILRKIDKQLTTFM